MILATFDFVNGWSFDGDPESDFGIRFTNGDADRIYFDNLAFGWTVLVNDEEFSSMSLPPQNTVILELTPSRIFSYRAEAKSDDKITLFVWATNAKVTVENQTIFTIPRPEQPYPSWTWENGEWVPPVPRPDDDNLYQWDEESQEWATVDPISEQGDD